MRRGGRPKRRMRRGGRPQMRRGGRPQMRKGGRPRRRMQMGGHAHQAGHSHVATSNFMAFGTHRHSLPGGQGYTNYGGVNHNHSGAIVGPPQVNVSASLDSWSVTGGRHTSHGGITPIGRRQGGRVNYKLQRGGRPRIMQTGGGVGSCPSGNYGVDQYGNNVCI